MMKKSCLLLTLIIISLTSFGRNIDSLITTLPNTPDSSKASALYSIASSLTYKNPNECKNYSLQGIEVLQKLNDTISSYYAQFHTQLGVLEKNKGNFNEAAKYQHIALKIHDLIGEKSNKFKASVYNDLGIIYKTLENWEVALNYYKKSNELCKKLDIPKGVLMTYNNIGTVLIELNHPDSAEYYYTLAYNLSINNNDLSGQALTLNNLGELLTQTNNKPKALEKFREALKIDRATGDRFGIVFTLMNIGGVMHELGNHKEAEIYLNEAVEIAKNQEAKFLIAESLNTLSFVYEAQKKYKNAYLTLRESQILNDSIFNEEKNEQIGELEAKYQNEKKQKEIELQQSKLNAQDAELEKKQIEKKLFIYIIIFAVLIVLGLIVGWNSKRKDNSKLKDKNTEIENQKSILEEKNKEITDSIRYAKRIQNAILPPAKIVKEYLQESFILYKPKDIVAGDFYWMESVAPTDNKKETTVLFAAADCTGHGVPGAMVSVICNNGLNRSVREHGLTEPGEILDKTREIVIAEFEKSEDDVKDGMDIAICSLKDKTLHYAGAHNPLWIIRKDAEEVEEIKANKQPIGKFENQVNYDTHTVELNAGDSIFIFSDGYVDQFGGEKGKKFKSVNFKKLLLSIQYESMNKQKELIDTAFENWRGNLEQIDDVCVIGVRV